MPNLSLIRELGLALYFEKVGLAGGICASFAHTILVPMDVLKTRVQISPEKYHNSFFTACRMITREEGTRKLLTGLTPTCLGYFAQGFMKFGLYEGLKYGQYKLSGPSSHPFLSYLLAASSAEVIATIFLCPFEAVRVRSLIQPQPPLVIMKQIAKEHPNPFYSFYKGIVPILAKQVPYTATQLSVFSLSIKPFYSFFFPGVPKEQLTKSNQLTVTVSCGIFAGAVASLVSHPADTIFTQMNSTQQSMKEVVKRIKFRGLWLGVGPRCVMTSLLSGTMFFVYDSVRLLVNLPTS